jgi:hypothetical protein
MAPTTAPMNAPFLASPIAAPMAAPLPAATASRQHCDQAHVHDDPDCPSVAHVTPPQPPPRTAVSPARPRAGDAHVPEPSEFIV